VINGQREFALRSASVYAVTANKCTRDDAGTSEFPNLWEVGLELVANTRKICSNGARLNVCGHVDNKTAEAFFSRLNGVIVSSTEGNVRLEMRVISQACRRIKRKMKCFCSPEAKQIACPRLPQGLSGRRVKTQHSCRRPSVNRGGEKDVPKIPGDAPTAQEQGCESIK
jgi:hypothetical protein